MNEPIQPNLVKLLNTTVRIIAVAEGISVSMKGTLMQYEAKNGAFYIGENPNQISFHAYNVREIEENIIVLSILETRTRKMVIKTKHKRNNEN